MPEKDIQCNGIYNNNEQRGFNWIDGHFCYKGGIRPEAFCVVQNLGMGLCK